MEFERFRLTVKITAHNLDIIKRILLSECSKKIFLQLIMLLIVGCSQNPALVPIEDLQPPSTVSSGSHIVKQGETLYFIAWLYNRDFRELARSNDISAPYMIFPGQRVDLSFGESVSLSRKTLDSAKSPLKTNHADAKAIKKHTGSLMSDNLSTSFDRGWVWPSQGSVVANFSVRTPENKGIDISGKLGEPVKAAASGEVVYAGTELSGYGKLIILKHNSSYLSAYAHNREIYVREGDSVKASQKIAEIGSTGTTEPKLHFEIRRNGKPVDPMGYLPKR